MAAKDGVVKNLPSSESGRGVQYTTKDKEQYVISQDPTKVKFTLWKVVPGGYEKIKAGAASPYDLSPLIPGFPVKA